MKELNFFEIIGKTLSSSAHLGDDCAYLESAGIFITQDTLVEDVHFSIKTTTPYELGQKAVAVNVSDLCATLGTPQWLTISLSVPKTTDEAFVEELYKGIDRACKEYGVEVVGGDITGSDKVVISVCAIAKQTVATKIGRGLAKAGDVVAIAGVSGASALGLYELMNTDVRKSPYITAHLSPKAQLAASKNLSEACAVRVATMDTSDGLADALFKISKSSKLKLEINADKIPTLPELKSKCAQYGIDALRLMLYGGEDFALVATMEREMFEKLDKSLWVEIGIVKDFSEQGYAEVLTDKGSIIIDETTINEFSFDHFKGNKE